MIQVVYNYIIMAELSLRVIVLMLIGLRLLRGSIMVSFTKD